MAHAHAAQRHPFAWRGTAQGLVQALPATFMLCSAGLLGDHVRDGSHGPHPAFWPVLLGVVLVLVGLGLLVDWRRTRTPLELVAPRRARAVIAVAVVAWVAWLAIERPSGDLCLAIGFAPLLFVVVDRITGPAWVIGRVLWQGWSRRGWLRREVVEREGARALLRDPSGVVLRVRTELSLELGPAHVDLEALPTSPESYRHDDVCAHVRQLETIAERAARAHSLGTAALALISGLSWLALPYCRALGRALA